MCLAEVKTLCPEEDEGHLSVGLRHPERLGRPVDFESDEEEYFKEELELMEDRKHRHTGIEANYEKRRSNKTVSRYLREIDTHKLFNIVIKQLTFCSFSFNLLLFDFS